MSSSPAERDHSGDPLARSRATLPAFAVAYDPPTGPWLLQSEDGDVIDFVAPSADMRRAMETEAGYFEAWPGKGGWLIGDRIDRPA
ncbi:MAG: hypothetical protein JWM47_4102 [Acidimicrobiales bacterium]|nr:hypothetical protein [Acidimicrobiales bacterium]